jgi:hypothetical protein
MNGKIDLQIPMKLQKVQNSQNHVRKGAKLRELDFQF